MRRNAMDDGVYAPAPPGARTYRELGIFIVDEETFAVRSCDADDATHS